MRSRRLTTAVTLVALVLVLLAMGAWGIRHALEPLPSGKASGKPTCTSKAKEVQRYLSRKDVQVSVYNAGTHSGLAGRTLQRLQKAGFVAGNAGNAPGTAEVRRAVVWTTKDHDDSARLVALALGGHTQVVVTTTDLGPGVDVLVGNRFNALDPAAPTRIKLAKPLSTCVQVS